MDYITEEKYSFDQNATLTDHVQLNDRFAVPWNKFQALDIKAGSCKPIESQEGGTTSGFFFWVKTS